MGIDLKRLEALSSLEIPQEKEEQLKAQLNDIVGFVEVLNKLDVSHIDATYFTLENGTPFREDEPKNNPNISKTILANAPKSEDGFFIVPKIIE